MEKKSENELIIRDFLARQRTGLANERTLLSYIRTSLYFLVSGVALIKVEDLEKVKDLGYLSFLICLVILIVGFSNFFKVRKRIKKGYYFKM
jgi:putative membrane protein